MHAEQYQDIIFKENEDLTAPLYLHYIVKLSESELIHTSGRLLIYFSIPEAAEINFILLVCYFCYF